MYCHVFPFHGSLTNYFRLIVFAFETAQEIIAAVLAQLLFMLAGWLGGWLGDCCGMAGHGATDGNASTGVLVLNVHKYIHFPTQLTEHHQTTTMEPRSNWMNANKGRDVVVLLPWNGGDATMCLGQKHHHHPSSSPVEGGTRIIIILLIYSDH